MPALREHGVVGSLVQGYGPLWCSPREAGIVAPELGRPDGSISTFLGSPRELCHGVCLPADLTDMEVISTYDGLDSMQALIVGRAITGKSVFTTHG